MTIELTDEIIAEAKRWQALKWQTCREQRLVHTAGSDNEQAEARGDEFVGVLGELLVAKALNERPQVRNEVDKGADHVDRFGVRWHVRAFARKEGSVIVRPDDPCDGRYVGVEIDLKGRVATIVGYVNAMSVPERGWWGVRGKRKEPAWWVSQDRLHPFSSYLERRAKKEMVN
jgi:hypothetical protein